ncbi:9315_t:CDS:1, partial [Gigaspora margarita]
MIKTTNEKETDNLIIITITKMILIETDPEAKPIIIKTKITILETKTIHKIEITVMTEMTTVLEVMIDPLLLHRDPLIILPCSTIG